MGRVADTSGSGGLVGASGVADACADNTSGHTTVRLPAEFSQVDASTTILAVPSTHPNDAAIQTTVSGLQSLHDARPVVGVIDDQRCNDGSGPAGVKRKTAAGGAYNRGVLRPAASCCP